MEQKICENCGAKIHVRTAKCPICSAIITEASQIVNDEVENTPIEENIGQNIDVQISDNQESNDIIQNNTTTENKNDVKDYVYKAEVRHSLEYTQPLSNAFKVILTAISTVPLIGQFIGTFLGIFFSTYDDNDRKSFGRALLFLSVIMFLFYLYSLTMSADLLTSGEFQNYFNNF